MVCEKSFEHHPGILIVNRYDRGETMKNINRIIPVVMVLLLLSACQTAPETVQKTESRQNSSSMGTFESSTESHETETSSCLSSVPTDEHTESQETSTGSKPKEQTISSSSSQNSPPSKDTAPPAEIPPSTNSAESSTTSSTSSVRPTKPPIPEESNPSDSSVSKPEPTTESKPSVTVTPMNQEYLNDLLAGVNDHRQTKLPLNADLCSTAQAHAEKMARERKLYHECQGVESVGSGGYEDGFKQGSMLTVHCPDLADEALARIGVGAARDRDGSIYVCILGKMY